MPTRGDGCQDNRKTRKPRIRKTRKPRMHEAELSYIIHEHGIVAVNKWVLQNCKSFFEVVWWRNKIREWEMDQRFTNAEQEAVWGKKYTNDIRLAGHRLKAKLVKAFLGTTQE
jgi:hypothetical protein